MTTPRLLAAAIACAVLALSAFGAAPASAKICSNANSPEYPHPKGGYYSDLRAFGISCSGAKDVMHGHYRCRIKNGIKGRCPRFSGWSCTETRRAISTEYNGHVVCRKDGRKVAFYYQQILR